MRPTHPASETLTRWLTAEREGSAEDADAVLRELLTALPPLAPPSGFADRVVARAVVAARPAARRRAIWASPWPRAALLLCAVTCGFALFWLPALLQSLGTLWSPAELLEKSIGGLMALHLWLAAAFGVGHKLVLLCEAFAAPLAIKPFAFLAAACLLISAGAFRVLRAVIHSDRRWVYVDPI